MEAKKEQKNKEKQQQKFRNQVETKQEHRAGRRVSNDTEKEKYIPLAPYRATGIQRASRRESKEQYESLDEYPLYPTSHFRRISSIREDPSEGLDYLRMSFDLWPRRMPSDALL